MPSAFRAAVAVSFVLAFVAPSPALAHDGGGHGGEVRVPGTCGGRAAAKLKLKPDDGRIEAEFEVEHVRSRSRWRVTIVQEHRIVWRGRRRAHAGSFEVRRMLADLSGADRISVRASSRQGVVCSAAATLPA